MKLWNLRPHISSSLSCQPWPVPGAAQVSVALCSFPRGLRVVRHLLLVFETLHNSKVNVTHSNNTHAHTRVTCTLSNVTHNYSSITPGTHTEDVQEIFVAWTNECCVHLQLGRITHLLPTSAQIIPLFTICTQETQLLPTYYKIHEGRVSAPQYSQF